MSLFACARERAPEPGVFVLWTMRTGDKFAALQERVRTLTRKEFTCRTIISPYRHCAVRSEGMPLTGVAGALHLIVDSTDAIVVLQFSRVSQYVPPSVKARVGQEWADEVRSITQSWAAVHGVALVPRKDSVVRVDKWMTADSSQSAFVAYDAGNDTAQILSVTDERKFGAMRASSPFADFVLGSALYNPEANAEAALMGVMVAANPRASTALVGPAPRVALADCELEQPDLVLPPTAADEGSPNPRRNFGEEAATALELGVASSYPGWKIVFGQQIYLVSPAGVAERVYANSEQTYETSAAGYDHVHVFSITRIGRLETARRRLDDANSPACRVPSNIIFVRMRDGKFVESALAPLDEEAVFANVGRMAFASGHDGATLVVEYSASYRSNDWTGTLGWGANVRTDPPRVVERQLMYFGKTARATPEDTTAGVVAHARTGGDTLSFHTLEEYGATRATRFVRVPLEPNRVLRASALLDRIR